MVRRSTSASWCRYTPSVVALGVCVLVSLFAGGAAAASPTWSPTYSVGDSFLGNGPGAAVTLTKIGGLQGVQVAQISAGQAGDVLVLSTGGRIFSWGYNYDGQVGDGTTTDRFSPVQLVLPAAASRVVKVDSGYSDSVALTATGQVLTWGSHLDLGTGTLVDGLVPALVPLPGNSKAVDVAAGSDVSVVTTSGRVFSWGPNVQGSLGNGQPYGTYLHPRPVDLPTGFVATSVSDSLGDQLILGNIGGTSEVVGFGDNEFSELGGPGPTPSVTPVVAQFPPDAGPISAVYSMEGQSEALTSSGKVYSWGYGSGGMDGNGTLSEEYTPTQVSLPAGIVITALATGTGTADGHSLALTSTNQVYGWGVNAYHQINPSKQQIIETPTRLAYLPAGTVTALGASDEATYLTFSTPAT